ncbi:protein of unknown function [Psychrobacillus sp. OK028]|uniref:DUF1850 domain-containing protein n=1 Tax=Psychrobacillus sp. OK028 TaxID=1884359 RepID=UPI00089259CD|nr:DUF1850 domain-containing protein [Psychrobacillus sp. OK028]SDM58117.1 protein of unknown function [Psychrobacillus sp. OK028]
MRFLKMYGIISLICVIGLAFFLPFKQAFVFTETRSDDPKFYYLKVEDEREFQVRYTHSIHKSDVIESYRITKDVKIQLVSMAYEDLAIGMPGYAEEGQTFEVKDGMYKLSYDDKVIDSFTILVANIEMDLIFQYKQRDYDLKKLLERSKAYEFKVKNISLYDQWKGVKFK